MVGSCSIEDILAVRTQFQSGRTYGIVNVMEPATEPTTSALNRLLEPLSRSLGSEAARQILALSIDPDVQARIDDLADLCNEGALTAPDRTEYEGYVEGISLINILKAKARRVLSAQAPNS
jgi:hypothetical protein